VPQRSPLNALRPMKRVNPGRKFYINANPATW